jgi:hypothetical protein
LSFPTEAAPAPGPNPRLVAVARAAAPAAAVAAIISVLGLGIGLLWRAVSPQVLVANGYGYGYEPYEPGFGYAQPYPEEPVAADGWFAFLGAGAGLAFAVLAWVLLRRHRGVAMLVGLVVGSLIGAWVAWYLGVRLEYAAFEEAAAVTQLGDRLDGPLRLASTDVDRLDLWPPKLTGVVLIQALAAAITYNVLAGFSSDPQLRPGGLADAEVDASPWAEPGRLGTGPAETVRSADSDRFPDVPAAGDASSDRDGPAGPPPPPGPTASG